MNDDDDLSATLIHELERSNGSTRHLAQLLANGHGIAQAHLQDHLRAHIYIPDFDQLRTYGENQSFPLDYEQALTCARAFERTPDALWRRIAASDPDRSYLRFWALMNGLLMESGQKKRAVGSRPLWQRDISKQRNTITICYGIYIDLLLIEERIARNLPAVEGIWLAKEPRAPF